MASIHFLDRHRSWEDWLGMGIGIAVALSPWVFAKPTDPTVTVNAFAIGAFLFVLSAMELFDRQRWEEYAQAFCGAWLFASPYLLAYAGSNLGTAHFLLGFFIVLLAVIELTQSLRSER